MIEIHPEQVLPRTKLLFNLRDPAGLRCIAVLDGLRPGRIFADSEKEPSWVVVWESTFGAIYPAGNICRYALGELIQRFRKERMVFFGLWLEDPLWYLVTPKFDQESRVLDFYDRIQDGRLPKFIGDLPEHTKILPVDENLIERSLNRDLHLSGYPSSKEALQDIVGFFLMQGDEICSEAFAGAEVIRHREIGVDTPKRYRQRGYATLTCAKLIQFCEQQGFKTYWNCNKFNAGSVALARKLGYQTEKEYRLLIWNKERG
jgi:RimJ/RimL family protein N-acetyltransferase